MRRILFENACARPKSRTLHLSRELLKRVEGDAQELVLYDEGLTLLDFSQLNKRNELLAVNDYEPPIFKYARQFAAADEIIMAAPYWYLTFLSILRVYLEQVTIADMTF